MYIHENINNYRIVVDNLELIKLGYTVDELIDNLKEASGFCGKPLGKHDKTFDTSDMSWVIFIDKEI